MKKKKFSRTEIISQVLFVLAIILVAISVLFNGTYRQNQEQVSKKMSARVEKRLAVLDKYAERALNTPVDEFLLFEDLPSDMVIYRYVNDSLQSWCNQFPLINDDISSKLLIERLTNLRSNIISPLSELSEDENFKSIGSKWYIIKETRGQNGVKIISGLEIKNTLNQNRLNEDNGVNRHLKLNNRFSIINMDETGGYPIIVHGVPLFKILYEPESLTHFHSNSILRWIAIFMIAFAVILNLIAVRTVRRYAVAIATLTFLVAVSYYWGFMLSGSASIFSPSTYADGPFFSSLGALILINTYIALVPICTYIMSNVWIGMIDKNQEKRKLKYALFGIVTLLSAVCIFIYMHFVLRSLILNSNISFHLFSIADNIEHSIIVFISFTLLILSILLHFQALRPVMKVLFGINFSILGKRTLLVAAAIASIYFTTTIYLFGFEKEQNKVNVWANRLSVDRDLALEIALTSVENGIASDEIIATLAPLDNTDGLILSRISEFYLGRSVSSYNLSLRKFGENSNLRAFNNVIRSGQPISNGSHFFFISDDSGHSRYVGLFQFYSSNTGLLRLMLNIEPNSNKEDRGYYGLMGKTSNFGEVRIPPFYSYAKYIDNKLVSYKGIYPYPMVYGGFSELAGTRKPYEVQRKKGYFHFIHYINSNEVIVLSRSSNQIVLLFTSFAFIFLTLSMLLYLVSRSYRRHSPFKRQYFKRRISLILMSSSIAIMVSITGISIWFVYNRSRTNMNNMMSDKINTVQAMLENRLRWLNSWEEVNIQELSGHLELIGNTTKSDITIYSADGYVIQSTTPEIFARMIIGCRINEMAFYNIRYLNQRYFINRENVNGKNMYFLYAPLINDNGKTLGFVCTPYTDRDFNFTKDAYIHSALILCLFLILLILAMIISSREVDEMLDPIVRMGEKMKKTDVHNLEYITYKRQDEISTLVEAYNRMVGDLKESTMKLTQAERDKAWSEMARQVAHEIKNPLTPIKLEIQRLIRMKQKGNPAWMERFDSMAAVVLEQIEILADTANEFSTFAKLYTEDPVDLDLDKLMKDQMILFDNKDNIELLYIGQPNAIVTGPKPQLTRVFINLISNAIQAVESKQQEVFEKEGEVMKGKITVCLRNSTADGYYDVVIDDNGAGVKAENLGKLFTPNFTTKNSGTGLGLAISRNIMEKCGGSITYHKSFALGGASFVVSIPKKQ